MALFLGVDIGTSTAKATVLDESCRIVYNSVEKLRILSPKPGFYEVNADKTWWQTFLRLLAKISMVFDLEQIETICVSSVCGSFVPLGDNLQPLYRAILYGIDIRAAEEARQLNRFFGEEYLSRRLGSNFTTHSLIPKFLWLKNNMPDVYEKTRYFVESSNYITSKLTGEVAWDFPTSSGCQLLCLQTMTYPMDILDQIGLDGSKLPKLLWPKEILSTVSKKASQITGLREGTRVLVGACDINMEAVSCGAVKTSDMVIVLGSTTSVLLNTDVLTFRKGFTSGVSLEPNSYRLGGATSSGARFVKVMEKLLRPWRRNARTSYRLPTGLIMLPYLDGARCPYHNPEAVGVIYGLRSNVNIQDLYIALYESLAIEIAVLVRKISDLIPDQGIIHVTGGLSKNELLTKLLASVLGKTLHIHNDIDASFGAALLAASCGLGEDCLLPGRDPHLVYPDSSLTKEYASIVEKYELIYEALFGEGLRSPDNWRTF